MDVKLSDSNQKKNDNGSCLFWIIIYLLFAICVCNVFLTLYLISVFEIGKGMRYIEVIDKDVINFYGSIDLDHVYKLDGVLEGFMEPFEMGNDKEPFNINLMSRIHTVHNKFRQEIEGTTLQGISNFEIRDPLNEDEAENVVFNAQKPVFNVEGPVSNVVADKLLTNGKITSDVDEKLSVVAKHRLSIKGSEGTEITGRDVLLSADKNLNIKSNGTISLHGVDGIFLDIERIPKADTENGLRRTHVQYKICVCFPSGRLFQVQTRGRENACYIPQYSANPCI